MCLQKTTAPSKETPIRCLRLQAIRCRPLGRPHERVLLLSGPPGYGKTTLASIVARHAGYRILEINASDDRSYQTVQTRIRNAVDAGTSLGAEGKPTCVVIDEIDGAGGGESGFIKALIKLIQDVPAKKIQHSGKAAEKAYHMYLQRSLRTSLASSKVVREDYQVPQATSSISGRKVTRYLQTRRSSIGYSFAQYSGGDDERRCSKLPQHIASTCQPSIKVAEVNSQASSSLKADRRWLQKKLFARHL